MKASRDEKVRLEALREKEKRVGAICGRVNGKIAATFMAQSCSLKVEFFGRRCGEMISTLRASPDHKDKGRIGSTAVEFVRGKIGSSASVLELHGYKKDDPKRLISNRIKIDCRCLRIGHCSMESPKGLAGTGPVGSMGSAELIIR